MIGIYQTIVPFSLYRHRISQDLWTVCNVRTNRYCKKCHTTKQVGATMYRPLTNSAERGNRICENCMIKLSDD